MKTKDIYKIFQQKKSICIDSRKIKKESLFFSLKGDNFNGNHFALDAIKKGCSYAIVDEEKYHKNKRTILVKNVLKTLQELAKIHRKTLTIPIIGITGTNGKTTSKELIHKVLQTSYKTYATEGNLNNHIGVPLSILNIDSQYEIGIIEMGANHQNEINFLCQIAMPNFGIITNVGCAHLEGFGDLETIIKTKNEIFEYISKNEGHIFVSSENKKLLKLASGIKQTTYGKNGDIKTQIRKSTYLTITYKNNIIKSNLIGSYQHENISLAVCLGEYFNIKVPKIKKAIEQYVPKNNRSEVINTKKNTIILDAYNANPSSMEAMLKSFSEQKKIEKICIIGDMLELGRHSTIEHQKILKLCIQLKIKSFFIGKEFKKINKSSFINKKAFVEFLKTNKIINKTILIKGSRGVALESLVEYL